MKTEFGKLYGKDEVAVAIDGLRKGNFQDLWIVEHYVDIYGPNALEERYGVEPVEFGKLIAGVDHNVTWRVRFPNGDGREAYLAGHWYNADDALAEAVRWLAETGVPHHEIIRISSAGEELPCGSLGDDMDD